MRKPIVHIAVAMLLLPIGLWIATRAKSQNEYRFSLDDAAIVNSHGWTHVDTHGQTNLKLRYAGGAQSNAGQGLRLDRRMSVGQRIAIAEYPAVYGEEYKFTNFADAEGNEVTIVFKRTKSAQQGDAPEPVTNADSVSRPPSAPAR